jgi:hypothetical protein
MNSNPFVVQHVASRNTDYAAAAQVRVRAEYVGFLVDKVVLEQVFSEYFGFPYRLSFHQFLHHHNHPGLAQQAYWWPQGRVDPLGLPNKKKYRLCYPGSQSCTLPELELRRFDG